MIRKIKNFFHFLTAILANLIYRFPSKKLIMIGVTGTDGKTTTVHLIGHLLKKNGFKVGIISTLSSPGLHTTTPDPFVLQKILRQMVNKGKRYVVLECSSHGLDQYRLWGIKFQIGVVTNVTHDHLDYHKSWENYAQAKGKLLENSQIVVLNKDDYSYEYFFKNPKIKRKKIITYAIKNEADFTPKNFPFKTKLPGEYNQYNCLAGIAVAVNLGIKPGKIKKALISFKGVKGRMEEIKMGQKFKVFVDFAKTASGLENALKTLKPLVNQGRLIAVFGSAGLRDIAKRKMMGEVAGRLANIAILTAEDPRTEDVNKIINQIAEGCLEGGMEEKKEEEIKQENELKEEKWFIRIPDRRKAIRFAIEKLAKNGDILVFCGKGHERSMCYGKKEYPWNEFLEVKKAIRRRLFKNVS
ncbi:MAG: Mur ligase family protein [Microgenomates group bacterium]